MPSKSQLIGGLVGVIMVAVLARVSATKQLVNP